MEEGACRGTDNLLPGNHCTEPEAENGTKEEEPAIEEPAEDEEKLKRL